MIGVDGGNVWLSSDPPASSERETVADPHICPWWLGYLLLSPLRKLWQNPKKILGPHIAPEMTGLDVGCGMGYFSLEMARLVGDRGKVVCVDLQAKMISGLERRAKRAGFSERIDTRLCTAESLGLEDLKERIDFALLFAVLHETPSQESFLVEVHTALRPDTRCLLAEPKGHVNRASFDKSTAIAEEIGFEILEEPQMGRSHAVLLHRPAAAA